MTVLGELVEHHVKEEEGEMFPKARRAIDVAAVGAELAERKTELADEDEGAELADPPQAKKAWPARGARRAS